MSTKVKKQTEGQHDAKLLVMCSAFTAEEIELLVRLKQLHKMLNGGGGLTHDEYDEYENISSMLADILPIRD